MDNSKAKKLLGGKPKHGLQDTLPTMVEKLKDNPKKLYQANNLNK
jgi:nucleoside-diphosphate-sugar epimerase